MILRSFIIRFRERRERIRAAKRRPLWRRSADSLEGIRIIIDARWFAVDPRYCHMSDGELIRLAYWGASGTPENRHGVNK